MAVEGKARSAKTALKRQECGELELRHTVSATTKKMLSDLMRWTGIKEQGEALTWMIHHVQGLGRGGVIRLIGSRHSLEYGENVSPIMGSEMIRFWARSGTCEALSALVEWTGAQDQSAAMRLVIHALHDAGKDRALPFLAMPPHTPYVMPEHMARRLDADFRRKTLRICNE
jgi:hypothetical protein